MNGMKSSPHTIPTDLPRVSEAGHERPARHRGARKQDARLPPQPTIKVIQLPACNHCHCRVPSKGYAQTGACYENHASRPPLPPSRERLVRLRVYPGNYVSGNHIPRAPTPTPQLISTKKTPSPDIIPPKNPPPNATTPTIHIQHREVRIQREMRDIPSSSTLSSTAPKPPTKRQPGTPHPNRPHMAHPRAQEPMSSRAAETMRVMEWGKERVKAAEKHAREQERALLEERMFLLKLRRWEAEMKVRRLVENAEGEEVVEGIEEGGYEGGLGRRGSCRGRRDRMRGLKRLVRDSRKRCQRGLAAVLGR